MFTKLKEILYKFIGILAFICCAIYSVLVVFVRFEDGTTGRIFDGLSRPLDLVPFWARFVLTEQAMWAGFWWHCADGIIAGCLFVLGYVLLFRRSNQRKQSQS